MLELDQNRDELFVSLRHCGTDESRWPPAFDEAKRLCQAVYASLYPDYALAPTEAYDASACLLYSRGAGGDVTGMLRVCFDSPAGLPIGASLGREIDTLRSCGVSVGEPGRFVIPDGRVLYKAYLRAIYQIAVHCELDVYLMQVRSEHADFYRRNCAASDIGGEDVTPGCTNLAWNIERTPPRFFRAFGADQNHLRTFLDGQG